MCDKQQGVDTAAAAEAAATSALLPPQPLTTHKSPSVARIPVFNMSPLSPKNAFATPTSPRPLSPRKGQLVPPSPRSPTRGQPQESRFDFLVREIVQNERLYCQSLEIAITSILIPLRTEAQAVTGVSAEEVQTLFGNMEELLPLHKKLALELEEGRDVASVYIINLAAFDVYLPYVKNYILVGALYEKLSLRHKFMNFIEAKMGESKSGIMHLPSYLIMPIQELSKAIKETPRDATQVNAALSLLRQLAARFNQAAASVSPPRPASSPSRMQGETSPRPPSRRESPSLLRCSVHRSTSLPRVSLMHTVLSSTREQSALEWRSRLEQESYKKDRWLATGRIDQDSFYGNSYSTVPSFPLATPKQSSLSGSQTIVKPWLPTNSTRTLLCTSRQSTNFPSTTTITQNTGNSSVEPEVPGKNIVCTAPSQQQNLKLKVDPKQVHFEAFPWLTPR